MRLDELSKDTVKFIKLVATMKDDSVEDYVIIDTNDDRLDKLSINFIPTFVPYRTTNTLIDMYDITSEEIRIVKTYKSNYRR
jgi:hypothetical protein